MFTVNIAMTHSVCLCINVCCDIVVKGIINHKNDKTHTTRISDSHTENRMKS